MLVDFGPSLLAIMREHPKCANLKKGEESLYLNAPLFLGSAAPPETVFLQKRVSGNQPLAETKRSLSPTLREAMR